MNDFLNGIGKAGYWIFGLMMLAMLIFAPGLFLGVLAVIGLYVLVTLAMEWVMGVYRKRPPP